ncbi:carcinoembryonic antigen-related cell adhesion molecule 5-like [Entelurus aequoreus]|uniref:carcinoembryonic antigen-related cell adhesion molecule 5-like n=1 Tax=Entelurus aequoreus TaxID=161455 RepID=UPI002B1E26D1|nr:carcinoembryonic antigen-related cell adhesion molecule 5-like [Entelurus aequoreus]
MSYKLFRATFFMLLYSGLCYGAGIIPLDLLRGIAGQTVTFETSLKPTPEPFLALTWSFNLTDSIITSTSVDVEGPGYEGRISLDKSTGSLVLRNLTEEDSGEYELIIVPYGAEAIHGHVSLEVLSEVSIPNMACPTENLIEGKSSVNLTCDAKGIVLDREWKKDGKPLQPGDTVVFYDGGRVLSISPVDRRDSGVFLCKVSNSISFDTAKCKLKVFYGPDEAIIDQDPVGAELEESVNLRCSAESLPKAKFSWKFKRSVMYGPEYYIEEMEKRHLGEYTCTAHNEITGLEASAVHTLRGSSYGAGVLPDNLVAIVGETVMFNTMLTPPPNPFLAITWRVLDISGTSTNVITSSSTNVTSPAYKDRITLFTQTGSLELRNVTLRDNGDYKVAIIPAGGAHQGGTCKLHIQELITNVVLVPNTTDLLESTSSVTMTCSFSTGSGLSFLWFNGSSEITASDRVQLTDGGSKLTIVGVTRYDQGPFRCLVFNLISNGTSNPVNLFISYGPENIRLTTSPSLEYFKKGSNIRLSCSASSRPPALFQWFLNGDPLSATGPLLVLTNVQENQSGNYSCHASNNKTQKYQTRISAITIVAPISSVEIKANATDILEFSGSVSLSCSTTGSLASFLWLNSSSEVTASENVKITNGGSMLTIVNVTRYDQGPFRCHVINPISNGTSKPVALSIIFGPENINLISSPSQEQYDEGSDISLVCLVDSGPPPLFRWFRNGDLLSYARPELQLLNIHLDQSGNYSCQAFNNKTLRNQTSAPVAISVTRSEISNVVIIPSTTEVGEFSSSVSLSCSCSGSFPSFSWRNGSAELTASERVHINDKGDVVTLTSVSRYDEGPFMCLVFNNFSNSTSRPVKLSINYGPEGIDLKLFPSQEYFERGSNISLTCSAASRPPAAFQWFLNGDLLPKTRPVLKLRNVQENQSGNYSCRAFNSKTLKDQTTQPSSIFIQTPVSNVVLTSNVTVMFEFHSVTMSCSFSTGSGLAFHWLNGSSPVTASERVNIMDGGSMLTIVNVTRFDQGPFRCNLSNGVSDEISRPMHLFIQHGPDSLTIEGPDSVHIGQHIMLHCSTMSLPTASFTWLFDGNPAGAHGPVYLITSSRGSDAGKYTCTAQNAVTGKSVTGHHKLNVLDFSDCDCSVAAGVVSAITIGCCLLIVIVSVLLAFGLKRRRRVSTRYPTHKRAKSMRLGHTDTYKIGAKSQSDV